MKLIKCMNHCGNGPCCKNDDVVIPAPKWIIYKKSDNSDEIVTFGYKIGS